MLSDRKGANGTTISTTWYHVTFFGDNNQRAWVSQTNVLKYEGPDAFLKRSKNAKSKTERQKYAVPANKKKVFIILWSIYRKFSNRSPPPIEAPPSFWTHMSRSLFTFMLITWLKIVRFSFRKKPLEGENALYNLVAPLRACLSTRCFY